MTQNTRNFENSTDQKSGTITVVGIGEDGLDGLSAHARKTIKNARVIFGGVRHLGLLPDGHGAEKISWQSPFETNMPLIAEKQDQNPVVLASGDPMFFGIGNTLISYFGPEPISVISHPSSLSLAAARCGWALADCDIVTLHGRPAEQIRRYLRPDGKLMALSHDGQTPALIAVMLYEAGYGDSRLTVCERLGGSREKITTRTAREWQHTAMSKAEVDSIDPLNVVLIDMVADATANILPVGPGLPDDAFVHDGMITKSEIRAQTLASLGLWKGAILWDLGAGCGTISVEWMRLGGQAIAIERDIARCQMIEKNAYRLGVPEMRIIHGNIDATLNNPENLPIPDAIFIGGGITTPELLQRCWDILPVHGRLVANTVTLEGEQELFRFYNKNGGTLSRLSVSRLAPRGGFTGWHNLAPVTHYLGVKA